jgi:hypothetical protein
MKRLLVTILCFTLISFYDIKNENRIYENYCKAIDNADSTYQYFLVVNILDKSTGLTTEVCLTGFELLSTMAEEWNLGFENESKVVRKLKRNKNRTFSVKSAKQLKFINRVKYSKPELEKFSEEIGLDSIVTSISMKNKWNYFPANEKEQIMLAHLLFNKGILTGTNECYGGMDLNYYTE